MSKKSTFKMIGIITKKLNTIANYVDDMGTASLNPMELHDDLMEDVQELYKAMDEPEPED
jgi:hypothetical protein